MSAPEHDFGEDVLIAGEKLRSFTADSDIDAHQAVTINGNFTVDVADVGGAAIGVAAYDVASGQETDVVMDDCEVRVIADGAVTAGDSLEVGTGGNFSTLDTGEEIALALEDAGDGDVFQAYITRATGGA